MKNIPTEKAFKWQRLQIIMEAIQSCRDQCITVPSEWLAEKIKLEKELGLREEREIPTKVDAGKDEKPALFNWVVFTKDGFGYQPWDATSWIGGNERYNWDESVHTFMTQTEANDWITWNKPKFSLAEIMAKSQWYSGNDQTEKRIFVLEELIQYAKSKQSLPETKPMSESKEGNTLFVMEMKWELMNEPIKFPCLCVPIDFSPNKQRDWLKAFITDCKIRGAADYFKLSK